MRRLKRLNPRLPRMTRGVWIILFLTVAYLIAAAIGAIVTGNIEFVWYLAIILVALAVTALIHWLVGLTTPLLAMMSLMGALHMAGGLMPVPANWPVEDRPVLYDLWFVEPFVRYDHVVHALGYGVVTWLWWQYLSAHDNKARPTLGRMLICGLASVGLGAANEMAEFIATQTLADTNVGGFENTGWDLVANFAGAMLAAIAIWLADWRRPEKR